MSFSRLALASRRLALGPSLRRPLSSAAAQAMAVPPPAAVDLDLLDDLAKALTPMDTVAQLDQHIVGQHEAKKAVAIAMRNRWRRHQLPDDLKKEVAPKNILMIGPTGCGKTEIARRMSKIAQAPFVKVEATKFTEVGFHGQDVDQMIKDLVDVSLALTRKQEAAKLQHAVARRVEDRLLAELVGLETSSTESFRQLLRDGALDDRKVSVEVKAASGKGPGGSVAQGGVVAVDSPASLNEMFGKFQELAKARAGGGRGGGTVRLAVKDARPLLEQQELDNALDSVDLVATALRAAEESGIVFIDEIDKVASPKGSHRGSADASAEGVQRDLLPLIEGCVVTTKHGDVNTDHILFVASGAFHTCKPSDLLAELQGRLPVRVELQGLTQDDLYRILTEPATNLIAQQVQLMATEGVALEFEDGAVREVARAAFVANTRLQNIGARRLQTIVERVMEAISFDAPDMEPGTQVVVTQALVEEKVNSLLKKEDLSKFIL